MVSQNVAVYEPPKQTSSLLLFWRLPEEWAEVLHGWVCVFLVQSFLNLTVWPLGYFYWSTEYHFDVLRNYGSLNAVATIWHTFDSSSQSYHCPD
jgi:ESCRT-II complex subunit